MALEQNLQQGTFTSTGTSVNIPLIGGITWMNVYNYTAIAAGTASINYNFYWQLGMPAAGGFAWTASADQTKTYPTVITNGFTLYNSSLVVPGALNFGGTAITAISTATPPVVTYGASTTAIPAGSIVRLYNTTGALQFAGMDFTVGYGTSSTTTFSLDYAPTIVAGTGGSFRVIPYDPIFYPRRRYITKITAANPMVVTTSVTHGYTVGQEVRLHVPAAYGMTQADGLSGTITAVNTATTAGTGNTFTLNIDSSAFTAFAFPLSAAYLTTPAEVVPFGEDNAQAIISNVNALSDATVNTATSGITLLGGTLTPAANAGPAGALGDVIYWNAGVSFGVL